MTTQIQKEYIKTVNCQKTSLDVLGRDSRTRPVKIGGHGHVDIMPDIIYAHGLCIPDISKSILGISIKPSQT